MTHDDKRNETTALSAALNALDGAVIGRCMPRHTSALAARLNCGGGRNPSSTPSKQRLRPRRQSKTPRRAPVQPPRVVGASPFGGEIYEGSKGAGLAKLVGKHPEVLEDLDGVVAKLPIFESFSGRIRLEDDTHCAIVALKHNGKEKQWLLTAFEKKPDLAKGPEDGAQGSRYLPPKGYAPDRTSSSSQEGAPSRISYSATNAIGQALGDFTAQELIQVRREANRVARSAAYSDPVKAQKAGQIAVEASRLLEGAGGRVAEAIRQADRFYATEFAPNFRQGPGRDIATRGPQGQESRMAPSPGADRLDQA